MVFYDAHCHLHDERMDAATLDAVLDGYARLNISLVVVNGTHPDDWEAVAALARRSQIVLPSFGLHPWRVADASEDWRDRLIACLDAFPFAGVGEIGLDRWIENPDLPAQDEAFRWQLELAARRNLPASIHCLRAWGALLDALRSSARPARGFLLHSYGGSLELARQLVGLGAYFSFSGYFAWERKSAQLQVFKEIPLERLLVETDAPDMLGPEACRLEPLRDAAGAELNHPLNIVANYRFAAQLRGIGEERFASVMAANWTRFFNA